MTDGRTGQFFPDAGPVCAFLAARIAGTEWAGKVFVAGGFVRDLVLGRPSEDVDLVVTAPDGGIRFAEWITAALGCRTPGNPVVYPRFGTAKFQLRQRGLPEVDIECVMPRGEAYGADGRKPEVTYVESLAEDAKRRDFTVNSLFLDLATGEVLDFTGGMRDIEEGRLRTAIDPAVIFRDDPLRILRAVRFGVRFGWFPEIELIAAINAEVGRVRELSQERITDELSKILTGDGDAARLGLGWLRTLNLLPHVLPELEAAVGVGQNEYHEEDVYHHTLAVLARTPPDLVTRLAALYHDLGKPATRSVGEDGRVHFYDHEEAGAELAAARLRELKFPNEVADAVALLVRHHMRLKQGGPAAERVSDRALRRVRADLGDLLPRYLDLLHADNCAHAEGHAMPEQVPALKARFDALAHEPPRPKLPIGGHDVMEALGLRPGPEVGRRLALVAEAWYANPDLTKEEAMQIVLDA
jgi:poly(A) polymerase